MNDIRLTLHLPNNASSTVYIDPNDRIADYLKNVLIDHYIPGNPEDFVVSGNSGQQVPVDSTFMHAGFTSGDEVFIKKNGSVKERFVDPGPIARLKTFHQLGILVLDGSGSMGREGANKITLADHVNKAVREFLGEFKNNSSLVANMSIAVITFDQNATLHTPPTPLETIDDLADYTPTKGHGGGTNIGAALEMAEDLAIAHLTGPDAGNLHCPVSIIVMSDGHCLNEGHTRKVAERIKSSEHHKRKDILICTSFFKSTGMEKGEEELAKDLLLEIVSEPRLYIVSYNYEYLRKFFIGSITASMNYGK